jgi:hypothetical protein
MPVYNLTESQTSSKPKVPDEEHSTYLEFSHLDQYLDSLDFHLSGDNPSIVEARDSVRSLRAYVKAAKRQQAYGLGVLKEVNFETGEQLELKL